jgi:hypothetical protein
MYIGSCAKVIRMPLDEIRIGLIGPTSAGKTSIFETFHESLDRGRHGFPRASNPHIRRTAEATPIEDLRPEEIIEQLLGQGDHAPDADDGALRGEITGTLAEAVVTRHYSLSYYDIDEGKQKTIQLAITDAAGRHSFGVQENMFKEYRLKLYRELAKCHGFVVVVPFSGASDSSFIRQLQAWLTALDKIAADQAKANLLASSERRRLVIALTRYDVVLAEFGSDAFNLAADPSIATDIINRLVKTGNRGASYQSNIARFDKSAQGRFEIALVPTSSFGFVPGFGCANLDPDVTDAVALDKIRSGNSPESFKLTFPNHPDQYRYPFLTADPFIFAATGIENPFIVPLDLALRQIRYADRPTKGQHNMHRADGSSPAPPGGARGPAGGANGGAKGPSGPEDDNWRRRLVRFLKRIDIEL